jgi:cytoskeletal protein CcmA (bactofilin family)
MLTFAAPALAQGPFGDSGKVVFGDNFTLESGQSIEGDLVVFGGNVTTNPESKVDGSMVAFGGNVSLDGDVTGDVAAVGGNVTINGTVEGDVASLGGNVILSESATVEGDIATFGGRVDVAEGATVEGDIKDKDSFKHDPNFNFTPPTPPSPPSPPNFSMGDTGNWQNDGWGSGIAGFIFSVISDIVRIVAWLIILGLISWLVTAFMPEQMMTVRRTISSSAAHSFGLGLITLLVSLVVGVVLLITICLAFIPIIGYILLAIASLFGWIVIGQMFGERLLVASGRHDASLLYSTIVGVTVLTLLTKMPVVGQIPCLGWALAFVGGIIGIILSLTGMGAVLLTRFGTQPYPATPGSYSSGGPRPSSSAGTGGGFGSSSPRVRWTDPAPDVSEEDLASSEAELRAKIKAALAEADADANKYGPKPGADEPAPSGDETPKDPADL